MKNQTKKLTTENGTVIEIDLNQYLDDDFCEAAIDYYCKKEKCSRSIMNSFFRGKAIESYIIDNNLRPVYE